MRESSKNELDKDVQVKDWIHPADTVRITEHPEDEEIQIFTDGRKNDSGVGAGIAIFIKGKLQHQLKYKLHNNCSNNQAEQMAIVKATEAIVNIYNRDSRRRTAIIYRQQSYCPIVKEPQKPQKPYRRNQKKSNRIGETRVDNKIYMD